MIITKIGHCCLLIEESGKRIMTDPGMFTVGEHELENIDIVVYTHEHGDHFHLESLKELVAKNPEVTIIANSAVGKLLDEAGIVYETLEGTDTREVLGVYFEAFDAKHEEIFEEFGQVKNTGYFITERLFYPGDAFADPGKPIEILALPVAGPWCKVCDVIRYALSVKPKIAFPVHDSVLSPAGVGIHHNVVGANLVNSETEFRPMKPGDSEEF